MEGRAGNRGRLIARSTVPMTDTPYEDGYWTSADGLKLHYRDYPGSSGRPPLICLPGLTRNARDFEELATTFAGDWRVICVENRGRGESEYASDSSTYNPGQYVQDLLALLEDQAIERFVSVGTSLGGLMTFVLAATSPGRLAGAVINDIGPVIEASGLERITDYVGQGRNFPTWMHAARALEETMPDAYPRFEMADWVALAKRLMVVSSNNRIVFDYDMRIAEPFSEAENAAPADMWPMLEALKDVPLLLVRGAVSDILSADTYEQMLARLPLAEGVVVDDVGHAPLLTEAEAIAGMRRMLDKVG